MIHISILLCISKLFTWCNRVPFFVDAYIFCESNCSLLNAMAEARDSLVFMEEFDFHKSLKVRNILFSAL